MLAFSSYTCLTSYTMFFPAETKT